ncbi:Ig-like domain-containing protein [Brevibacillus laterosporus]|uniref:Ig-like domain-containing protein n=1 Tax=Brevibacillus laterosporus TaxID=1465 RepID=UPI00265233C6|nr:hypothetical protein [Brevibacillus laterosporus]MDN9012335.1 hypothetical protein [Brevibacillus laterosporus]MDO0943477.1 hypothetical protein [Brevibacillus laterosporus]
MAVTYLGLVELGTLSFNGTEIDIPTRPYPSDVIPPGAFYGGNIPDYRDGYTINFNNTSTSPSKRVKWHKINDNGKILFICDRVLIANISWGTLDELGLVKGKIVTIDGEKYKCRILSGGISERGIISNKPFGGIPTSNEWDRIVINESNIVGLAKPNKYDINNPNQGTIENVQSEHNKTWNWYSMVSWCQELVSEGAKSYSARGGDYSEGTSANGFASPYGLKKYKHIGWRPVLEVLNQAPTLALASPSDNQTLTENSTLNIQGTASDLNNGDILVFKCQINNGSTRALQSGISNGSTPISFAKTLTYRGGRLFDGSLDVSGLLDEGSKHTLSLWAEDDQGGKSDVVTRTFTVKHNKAPIITIGTFPAVQSGLIPPDSITLSGTSSDPDGNTLTVKGKLNSGKEQTLFNGVTSGNWSYTCKVSDLKDGSNTITITATDQFGAYTVKTFNINNAVTETPLKKAVARYKIFAPKGSAREILAWLKREKGNLVVDAEASFVDKGLPEQYTAMTKESVDLTSSISEDELLGAVATAKSDIMFKLTLSRTNTSTNESAVLLVGVLS